MQLSLQLGIEHIAKVFIRMMDDFFLKVLFCSTLVVQHLKNITVDGRLWCQRGKKVKFDSSSSNNPKDHAKLNQALCQYQPHQAILAALRESQPHQLIFNFDLKIKVQNRRVSFSMQSSEKLHPKG